MIAYLYFSLLVCFTSAFHSDALESSTAMCIASSEHIELKICNNVQMTDRNVVVIRVRFLNDVLIPDAVGCFSVDSTDEGTKCFFRNYYCPNKNGVLILSSLERNAYKLMPKDSFVVYSKVLTKGTHLKSILTEIIYIPVNTYLYRKAEKKIIKRVDIDGKQLYYIRDEEVRLLSIKNSLECFR